MNPFSTRATSLHTSPHATPNHLYPLHHPCTCPHSQRFVREWRAGGVVRLAVLTPELSHARSVPPHNLAANTWQFFYTHLTPHIFIPHIRHQKPPCQKLETQQQHGLSHRFSLNTAFIPSFFSRSTASRRPLAMESAIAMPTDTFGQVVDIEHEPEPATFAYS